MIVRSPLQQTAGRLGRIGCALFPSWPSPDVFGGLSGPLPPARAAVVGPDEPYRMYRSPGRSAAAVAHSAAAVAHDVMARLVRAIYPGTCAATDGPDEPGHDDGGT